MRISPYERALFSKKSPKRRTFLPISGMTDQGPRLPIIGSLRKGSPKKKVTREGGRQVEIQGDDLSYFRFAPRDPKNTKLAADFAKAYGEQPDRFDVMLAGVSTDQAFDAWMEEHKSGSFLHRCFNGKVVLQLASDKKSYNRWEFGEGPECPGNCKQTGRLKVILPKLPYGIVIVHTTSINDIVAISGALQWVEGITYREDADGTSRPHLHEVMFTLARVKQNISTPFLNRQGERTRVDKYLIQIEPSTTWMNRQLKAGQVREFRALSAGMEPDAYDWEDDDDDDTHPIDGEDARSRDPAPPVRRQRALQAPTPITSGRAKERDPVQDEAAGKREWARAGGQVVDEVEESLGVGDGDAVEQNDPLEDHDGSAEDGVGPDPVYDEPEAEEAPPPQEPPRRAPATRQEARTATQGTLPTQQPAQRTAPAAAPARQAAATTTPGPGRAAVSPEAVLKRLCEVVSEAMTINDVLGLDIPVIDPPDKGALPAVMLELGKKQTEYITFALETQYDKMRLDATDLPQLTPQANAAALRDYRKAIAIKIGNAMDPSVDYAAATPLIVEF